MNGLIRYTQPTDLFDWNRVLDSFFTDVPLWNTRTPAVNVKEEEKRYLMEVELPGLSDKDVELKVEESILTISSKKDESKEEKKDGFLLRERCSSEFARTFVLPNDVDRENIKAEFKNGLLMVDIPKKPEAQPRKIDVKVN
jgi:HSP20 family protein